MTHTNPAKGEFTPTSLVVYLECPRKYYFTKVLGLERRREFDTGSSGVAKAFGSAIHAGVAEFYKTGKDVDKALQAFSKTWEVESAGDGDTKRNVSTGTTILTEYCAAYKNDDTEYISEYIEVEGKVEMPNSTLLVSRIDRVSKTGNLISPHDTKTSGSPLTDYYFLRYRTSFQMFAYAYTVQQILGACDSVVIDGILVPYAKSKDCFVRRSFFLSQVAMAEWLNTYTKITDKIIHDLSIGQEQVKVSCFYQNHNSCGNFGGCPFLEICSNGFNHPAMQEFEYKK